MNDRFVKMSIEKANNLKNLGFTDQALAILDDVLSMYPGNTELCLQKSVVLFDAGRYTDVLVSLDAFTEHSTEQSIALFSVGCLFAGKGLYIPAKESFLKAITANDNNVWAYNNLGLCCMELGTIPEAYTALHKAVERKPDSAEFQNNFANVCMTLFRLSDAVRHYQRALDLKPDYVEACKNLGRAYILCGDTRGMALVRRALELDPLSRFSVDFLLFSLNYLEHDPLIVFEEHRRWAPLAYSVKTMQPSVTVARRSHIRVGYVSADFKSHPVATFFEPVLRYFDRSRFEVFCYAQVPSPDTTTERLREAGGLWRSIVGLTDSELADLIRQDGIDILVDLSGFTEGNRLGTFVLKPASIQCSWLGYPNTTGLEQIDYRITDAVADPPGMTDHLYTETLIRLPNTFLCYLPGTDMQVPPCPAEPITFCCFNNLSKVSEHLIPLWTTILRSLPTARLLLKSGYLADPQVCSMVLSRFQAEGIEPERIEMRGWTPTRLEHLKLYGGCHIALDTYPYHGTTTTCEALWMGVPVVSLAGISHVSRVGASILTSAGVSELVAASPHEYIATAVELALDHDRLVRYRQTLRTRMQSSALLDSQGFVADLEQAFTAMILNESGGLKKD